MSRAVLAVLAIIVILAPMASGASAYGRMDGVDYGFGYGVIGSMHASIGPSFNGENLLPVDGCAVAIIREDGERGRVRAFAFFGGSSLEIDFSNSTQIMLRETVDGREDHGAIQHPEVVAELAMYGESTLVVDGYPYLDPVTLDDGFKTSFVMTPTNYRTDGVVAREGDGIYAPGDPALLGNNWEMHLRVEGGGGASSSVTEFTEPGDGLGRFTQNTQYSADHSFYNTHFNGQAELKFEFESEALAGLNELNFRVRAPDGGILGNGTVTASLGAPGVAQVDFPLDQFGFYNIEVSGQVLLSQYTASVQQTSSEPFDLWFWWEETKVGVDAWYQFADCSNYIGEPNAVVSSEVGRATPPQMNLTLIVLAILGTLATLLVGGKLFGQTIAAAKFKDTYRRR